MFPSTCSLVTDPHGLQRLEIASPVCTGSIYLMGAHVTEWTPAGAEPIIFLSGKSFFQKGKAIRGGIPLCFPWFGPRKDHPESPMHGFARRAEWSLAEVTERADGAIVARLTLPTEEPTRAEWDASFSAEVEVLFGDTLEVSLKIANTGSTPIAYEDALHTYFHVGNIHSVTVSGLEQSAYTDKVAGGILTNPSGEPIRFTGETDRVYHETTDTCSIHDPEKGRIIVIAKVGSRSTVVWNPWIAKAAAMTDFGDDEWTGMVCVETANTGEAAVQLAPGASHSTKVIVATAKLSSNEPV
jgi:glucose-6-phosphate 1-epimerase